MATKLKPQGLRYKKFEIWIKVAKLPKPQESKMTVYSILICTSIYTCMLSLNTFST
ncbi:hypothetical protein HanIR_Chr01g0026761 [Helianthus annuus]|nr:hypothetical protein HanIR_Chr01g0026761 [Helianthus annuus]